MGRIQIGQVFRERFAQKLFGFPFDSRGGQMDGILVEFGFPFPNIFELRRRWAGI
jgi:hypothetical protein